MTMLTITNMRDRHLNKINQNKNELKSNQPKQKPKIMVWFHFGLPPNLIENQN